MKVVLLTARGEMSPPIDMPTEDGRDEISLNFCRVRSGKGQILVTVDFRKTDECVVCGDSLASVYKEYATTKRSLDQ